MEDCKELLAAGLATEADGRIEAVGMPDLRRKPSDEPEATRLRKQREREREAERESTSITSPLLHSSVTPSRVTGRDMEKGDGEGIIEPALDAYQRICPNVSENALRFLDELIASFGQEGTAEAIGQAALDGRDKLLSRAKSILVLRAREADRAEAEDERRRNAAKRAPTPWQLAPAARSDGLVPVAAALPAHIPRPAFMGPEPTVKAKP
jgi:hypothetical protein